MFAKSCRAWSGFGDWKVKGKALPRSRKFKYLGVELHDIAGTKGSAEHRLSCIPCLPSVLEWLPRRLVYVRHVRILD